MKLKKDFHHRLFGFVGFSGVDKIISRMDKYEIGHIKQESQKNAGARVFYTSDSDQYTIQVKGESFTLEKEFFKDCDFVIVEGHEYSDHPKFLFLDDQSEAEVKYLERKITTVIATIYGGSEVKHLKGLPTFHKDDVAGICSFIESEIHQTVGEVELMGLVLAGGKSTRMGQDKSLMSYNGKPQAIHLWEILSNLGLKTFLSCRKEQVRSELIDLPVISDRFIDFGPLGGVLSAMTEYPGKAFLVMACDLPLVDPIHVKKLIDARDPLKQATAFFNDERKMFEPLFAIYEPQIYSRLLHFLGERKTCPQKVLFNSSIRRLELPFQDFLFNANTPDDGRLAMAQIEGTR